MDERLKRLIARRNQAAEEREKLLEQRKAIVDLAEDDSRDDLTEDEDAEFRTLTGKIKESDEELRQFDERITELSEEMRRHKEVEAGAARVKRAIADVQVMSEVRTYEQGNGRSYFRDLVLHQAGMDGSGDARARLERHAEEVRTDKAFAEVRQLSRTDGAGGHFVPPLHLVQQWIALARAGRPTANVVSGQPLPPGTDSINIPKVASGAATAVQTADNTAVSNTDLTDEAVSAPVRTVAGEQDVAVQLLEQSPVNFDEVIFQDLVADFATRLNTQVIGGSGAAGQVLGIRNTTGVATVTYTDTAPSVGELYAKLSDAIQRVHTLRFMAPDVIVMHPRRWAFFLAALDTTNRPLVLPATHNPQNAVGVLSRVASENVVGNVQGLPVVVDSSIPTNVGAGVDEDVILVMRSSDHILWESGIRTRVVLSASGTAAATSIGARTLTTTLQVYGYLAFTAARYPQSTSIITGTGLISPSF